MEATMANANKIDPTALKPGDTVFMSTPCGAIRELVFVSREPHRGAALNVFSCEEYRGAYGPEDEGLVSVSDAVMAKLIEGTPRFSRSKSDVINGSM
jgi:hypothetical protein